MRILIVEDEKRLAGTLQELLHRQGYTADVCYDGISGLDNARSDIYDLLVLDAMLPGMDGFTLLRQLRQGGDQLHSPVAADNGAHHHGGIHRGHDGAAAIEGRKMVIGLVAAVVPQAGRPDTLHAADTLAAVYHQIAYCKHHAHSLSHTTH